SLGQDIKLPIMHQDDRIGTYTAFPHQLVGVEPDEGLPPTRTGLTWTPRPILAQTAAMRNQQHRAGNLINAAGAAGQHEIETATAGLAPGQYNPALSVQEVAIGLPGFARFRI